MGLLSKITSFFGGSGLNIIDSIADTVDRFHMSEEEKGELQKELARLKEEALQNERDFELKVRNLLHEHKMKLEDTIQQELDAKKSIIEAELNQGDNFTKRARPTVVYVGLIFIFLEMFGVRLYLINEIFTGDANLLEIIKKSDDIFKTFLTAWAAVVGAYALGRSAEKYGVSNRATRAITGSKKIATPGDRRVIEAVKEELDW